MDFDIDLIREQLLLKGFTVKTLSEEVGISEEEALGFLTGGPPPSDLFVSSMLQLLNEANAKLARRATKPSERLGRNRLGALLRAHRMNLGQTQSEVAQAARISRTFLSDVERGRRRPSHTVLADLAAALKVPVDSLVDGTDWEHLDDEEAPIPIVQEADSSPLSIYFDLTTVDATMAARVIDALGEAFGERLEIVRSFPIPPDEASLRTMKKAV